MRFCLILKKNKSLSIYTVLGTNWPGKGSKFRPYHLHLKFPANPLRFLLINVFTFHIQTFISEIRDFELRGETPFVL